MRILLSFQLWLLPQLDKRKSSDGRWGLESFCHPRITDLPCEGRKTWLQFSEAMAPPTELDTVRMCKSFPLFQHGHAKKNTVFYTRLIGL